MNVLVDRASSLEKYSKMKFSVWKISHVNNATHARRGIMRANHTPTQPADSHSLPWARLWAARNPPPSLTKLSLTHIRVRNLPLEVYRGIL